VQITYVKKKNSQWNYPFILYLCFYKDVLRNKSGQSFYKILGGVVL